MYASVTAQSGLFAGAGGYDVNVGRHTQLDGAVIASTADASLNSLDTGTLGFSDIHNHSEYKTEHVGVNISSGGSIGSHFVGNMGNALMPMGGNSGHDTSKTRAAVSEGALRVRDAGRQQQDPAALSRDTLSAHRALSPLLDKEREQTRLQEVRLVGDIGGQIMDIAATAGALQANTAASQAAAAKMSSISEADRREARAQLLKENNPNQSPTDKQISDRIYQNAYNQAYAEAMSDSGLGIGGVYQRVLQSATLAMQGLAGGNVGRALAGGASPFVASGIKQATEENSPERLAAHTVAGAILSHLQGQSALAGGIGALAGETAAGLVMQNMYPGKSAQQLSEREKRTVSLLGTLAAGVAGGLTGQGIGDVVAGAQAGKNAVKNNFLSPESMPQGLADLGKSVTSYAKYAQDNNLSPEQVQADLTRMVEGDLPEGADIVKAVLSNTPVSDTVMAVLTAQEAKDYALALLSTLPAERALAAAGKAANVITNKHIIRAAEKVTTAKPGMQFTQPRDLSEQTFWKQIESNPSSGFELKGLNKDPRFPASAGFQKMEATHKLPDGSSMSIHYQYNSATGKAYDMKITTPQPNPSQPGPSLKEIK